MSVPLETSLADSPLSRVRTSGLQDVARALADDPGYLSAIARSSVIDSGETRGRSIRKRHDSEINVVNASEIVDAINELRSDLGGIGLYLDTGKLVGGITPQMDRSLGRARKRGSLAP